MVWSSCGRPQPGFGLGANEPPICWESPCIWHHPPVDPHLLVLLVPDIEGLLGIGLVLEDAQQVAVAKGINGLW